MNPSRFLLLVVAGGCLLASSPLSAQDPLPPFELNKQYNAEMTITPKDGQAMMQKIYSDDGKVRTEMSVSGMQMVSIIRPDQKKIYSVMPAQKMVTEMAYDAGKTPMAGTSLPGSKFEVVGPDTVDGVACTKYKETGKDNKVAFLWVDTANKALVKMVPEDGSVTIIWKNYVVGPQDAALFEPPAGYQVLTMPAMPGGG
jgi:outer membrane lipoprotein-sorting protein